MEEHFGGNAPSLRVQKLVIADHNSVTNATSPRTRQPSSAEISHLFHPIQCYLARKSFTIHKFCQIVTFGELFPITSVMPLNGVGVAMAGLPWWTRLLIR